MFLEALEISPEIPNTIAICGAGGKTTLMHTLAREAAARGISSAIYTTTHIMRPDAADIVCCSGIPGDTEASALERGMIIAPGELLEDGRWGQPHQECLDWLSEHCRFIAVEADGSKRLPLKYPAAWEPVIPETTGKTIVVCGLSCLDKPLSRICHRWELAKSQQGFNYDTASEEAVAHILAAGYGQYRPTILLNQADEPSVQNRACRIRDLLTAKGIKKTVIASLHKGLVL